MRGHLRRAGALLCALAAGCPGLDAWSAGRIRPRGAPAAAPAASLGRAARTARAGARALDGAFNGTWPSNEDVCEGMTVRLFPGYAQQVDSGGTDWRVSLRGWVCDSQIKSARRRLTSRALQRGVWTAVHAAGEGEGEGEGGAHPARTDAQRQVLLRRRVSIFLTKSHARLRVAVALSRADDGRPLWSSETDSAGHFTMEAVVPQAQLLRHGARQLPGGTWLARVATTPAADGRVFETGVLLIPPRGVSVISDIDDTIKQTGVHSTRAMLRSTFLEEWEAVAGMAELYAQWALQGAAFHYVSSSPWQLQPQLESLLAKAGFPPGTFHLKDLHYRGRRLLNLFRSSTALKPKQIRCLLAAFPQRRFVLVGDSGEKDGEIYAQICRQFVGQVAHVYIRNVPTKQLGTTSAQQTRARLSRAFRGVPDERWTVFDRAAAICEAPPPWAEQPPL